MNKKNINLLIEAISPLYNQYKQQSRTISGTDALIIMWDIGDILKTYIEENNVAPHSLFWEVYGKSEGTKNIAQKSYITREFQNRCHRIRNIFLSKEQIRKELPNLNNFTSFREAMPFFDNKKYKLLGEKKEYLLKLLNSDNSHKDIMKEIGRLQKDIIGIKNPRTQRLKDLEEEKEVFINFYNEVYRLLKESPTQISFKLKKDQIDKGYIVVLANNTNALAEDGLKFTKFPEASNVQDSLWKSYEDVLKKFSSQRNAVLLRRFRRIISAERIVNLADMLHSLSSVK